MQAVCVLSTHTLRTRVRWITVEDFCVFNARVCHGDESRHVAARPTGSQVGSERVGRAATCLDSSPWHTRARKSVNPIPVLSVDERFWDFCVQCATNCAGIERHCVRGPREGAFNTSSSTSGAQIHHRRSPLENDGDGGFCQGDDVRGRALLRGPREMQSESRMRPRARASVLASARTPPRRLGRALRFSEQIRGSYGNWRTRTASDSDFVVTRA